jgi:hypothetical protein
MTPIGSTRDLRSSMHASERTRSIRRSTTMENDSRWMTDREIETYESKTDSIPVLRNINSKRSQF